MGNKWLIGAAAAFAATLPGAAFAETNGHVKFTYASLDESGDPSKEGVTALSGGVVTDLGSSWRLQFNGAGADMDHSDHSDAFSSVEAHAAYDFGNFSLGGFLSNMMAESLDGSYWGVGAEATATFGRFGLNGSVSNFESNGSDDDVSNYGVGAGFRITDSFHLGANGSWTDTGDDDVESFGISAGYQFPVGIGLALGWRTTEFDSADTDAISLSVSYSFGESAPGRYLPGAAGLLPDLIAIQ